MSIRMHVHRWGHGPRVVLVHGAVLGGREAWRAQRPLAQRWTLLAPDRPGHGGSPPARQDFESEAALLAEQLLDEPAHLVGMSYGAIVAMYAAARRVNTVSSLAVIEPPATAVARGVAAVDAYGAAVREILGEIDADPEDALHRFLRCVGAWTVVSDPTPPVLIKGIRQLLGARPPDEAQPPLQELANAQFPTLVVSGGHMQANEVICDTIAERIGAARAIVRGKGHLVPETGQPFNDVLDEFMRNAHR
ncbi:alpha/beta fold hydrolase [Mycobacterium riyadhense]|uniref:Putative hydrolase n=1 Tax=Mycobacterium riyadhense TaxID=486698 RepID=A0A653F1V2_9MYCO|nr:alpha/beta hydrolase [Mycobacterium riyadhense]VTP02986.1 putative hydrolase [Mycobacterium riyadhense]